MRRTPRACDVYKVFTRQRPFFIGILTAGRYTVSTMNTVIPRARQLSLALLVIAVVYHAHLGVDYSGARPNASGLTRVGRDLMRRTGGEIPAEAAASDGIS
jgi:hypothetical protein